MCWERMSVESCIRLAMADYSRDSTVIPIVYDGNLNFEIWGQAAKTLALTLMGVNSRVQFTTDKNSKHPVLRWFVFYNNSVLETLESLGHTVRIYNASLDDEDMNHSFAEQRGDMAASSNEGAEPYEYD